MSADILTHSITVKLCETQTIISFGQMHKALLPIWSKDYYGSVGKNKANKALLDGAEKQAEILTSDFLTANPKNP